MCNKPYNSHYVVDELIPIMNASIILRSRSKILCIDKMLDDAIKDTQILPLYYDINDGFIILWSDFNSFCPKISFNEIDTSKSIMNDSQLINFVKYCIDHCLYSDRDKLVYIIITGVNYPACDPGDYTYKCSIYLPDHVYKMYMRYADDSSESNHPQRDPATPCWKITNQRCDEFQSALLKYSARPNCTHAKDALQYFHNSYKSINFQKIFDMISPSIFTSWAMEVYDDLPVDECGYIINALKKYKDDHTAKAYEAEVSLIQMQIASSVNDELSELKRRVEELERAHELECE